MADSQIFPLLMGDSIGLDPASRSVRIQTPSAQSHIFSASQQSQASNSYIQLGLIAAIVLSVLLLLFSLQKNSRNSKRDIVQDRRADIRVPPWILAAQAIITLAMTGFVIGDRVTGGSSPYVEAAFLLYLSIIRLAQLPWTQSQQNRRLLGIHSLALIWVEALSVLTHLAPFLTQKGTALNAQPLELAKNALLSLSIILSFTSPREYFPPQLSLALYHRTETESSPEQTCSYFSYFVSYGWLTSLILKGSRRRLVMNDLLPLPEYDEPLVWKDKMQEARARFESTTMALAYALRETIGRMMLYAALTAIVEFIAPLSLYMILGHIQHPESSSYRPWVWVAMAFLGPTLRSVCYQQYIFASTRLIVRVKLGLVQELFAKASAAFDPDTEKVTASNGREDAVEVDIMSDHPSITSRDEGGSENVMNLIAYDVDAICNSRDFILVSVAAPIEIGIGLCFLYYLLGPCALLALGIMLTSFPLASILSGQMSSLQRQVMRMADRRVSVISEYLSSMRIIKYLAWDNIMAKNIETERHKEELLTWKRNLLAVAVVVLGDFIPLMALFVTFATYTLVLGNPLTAATAFTALSIIETLRLQFVWIANATRFISQGLVGLRRIDKYIRTQKETVRHQAGPPAVRHATFRRAFPKNSFKLHLDVDFVPRALNVIHGQSGSGKTSLLLSLLGETILENGSATCPRDVAYAPQVPWLLTDTIKGNILMHDEFDHERYSKVLEACGLLPDLANLEEGDATKISLGGSNLSGGQRQRINLARAVYSHSPLLLLDDVFSALDAVTKKHIWSLCFASDLLKGRTVILVTQLQAAKDAADLVMELSHGSITSLHRPARSKTAFSSNITAPSSARAAHGGVTPMMNSSPQHGKNVAPLQNTEKKTEDGINQEMASQGRNPRTLFFQYMLMFGGRRRALLAIILCIIAQLSFFAIPLWLSTWVGAADREDAQAIGFYVGIYGVCLTSFCLFSASSLAYFQASAWQVAHAIHQKLTRAIMSAPLDWHDANPAGRVINRFSRDIFSLDSILVDYLRIAMDNGIRFMLRLTAIGSIMPIFGLPAAIICAVGLVCAEMYTRTELSVKALASASQSPIFTFFSEAMAGRSIMRARQGMQSSFEDDLARRLRIYARAAEMQYNLNRWICVRADGCAAVIALATGIIALSYGSEMPAGLVGFSLTNAIGLGQTILSLVRNMNELEVELNCFQRTREYANVLSEDASQESDVALKEPEVDWPSNGCIEFRNVTARYQIDGPDILRNVSFTINAGEKIAIVGRTGSGKSTLALSLLSFVKVTSGCILVDGVDLSQVPVRTLRQRLTIVPQEPVLFSGDVRFNLDPSRQSSAQKLSGAIEFSSAIEHTSRPGIGELHGDREGGRKQQNSSQPKQPGFCVDTPVASGGSNFSVGQRQILNLARASIRDSKIVILDEATASVDHASDVAMQTAFRSLFSQDTIVAIVHRLSTVIDYDRIIVMKSGQVEEIGTPLELYEAKGQFHDMVARSIHLDRGGEWTTEKLDLLERSQRPS